MKRAFLFLAAMGLLVGVIGAALAALPPGGSFVDDDGNIHEGNIEAIAAEDITKGCNPPTNDRYCPSNKVTRGQMAAFLVRALDLSDRLTDPFVDDDRSVFEADIERLAAAGITKGCNPPKNDRYCPDGVVTRGQMAAFLVRAFSYTNAGGGDLFVDDDASIFEADIDRLGTAGITKGCNPPRNDRYCPDDAVLRDQMASFLARALKLKPMSPPPRGTTTSTTSPTSGPVSKTCVAGWITPAPGTALRTVPLDHIRNHLGLGPGDLFVVQEMRYFTGPEDVEVISPRRNVERWYVEASLRSDSTVAGRWIVRRIPIGEGVAYEARAGTTGFSTGTWWSHDAGGYDPFTPACLAPHGPFCTCDWGVSGCSCVPGESARPICTGPPPEVMGCVADL